MTSSISKKKALSQIKAIFHRNGYVRYQNLSLQKSKGSQVYKKGNEVRLVANSEEELIHIQQALEVLEFTSGRPFVKSLQFRIPIYGQDQVTRFLNLVNDYKA